ncbi:MAG: SpoIIE family protein phosphatase, partial [Planctomycetaceae bacterium]|nr:SpoIIE family protein phosphatase [Planctomycetaceae bacterium]
SNQKRPETQDETFPLLFETTVLGRHPYCEVIIDHGAVSREHARISRNNNRYYVEDLHSRNGTFLNGKPVERKQPLFNGDVIRVCDLEFVFISESNVRPPTASDSVIDTLLQSGLQVVIDESPMRQSMQMTSQIPLELPTASTIRRKKSNSRELKFRALIDMGRNLGFQSDDALPKLTQHLLKIFPKADCAYFFLKDEGANPFVLQAFEHSENLVSVQCGQHATPGNTLHISRSILEKAAATKVAILSDDVSGDSWFEGNQTMLDSQICSIMVTPLLDFNRNVFGMVQLDSRATGKRFDSDDLDMLVDISHQIAISYENMRYYEAIAQERAMEREMSVAHRVQKGFLPIRPPKVENYGFFDYYQPAQYLGGDYFDYIPLPDGRLVVALGDVSGKGVPAALLMAKLSAEVRYSLVTEPTLPDAMHRLNMIFCEERWDNRFITFLLTCIDTKSHTITMLNAGHNAPLICNIKGIGNRAALLAGVPAVGIGNREDLHPESLSPIPYLLSPQEKPLSPLGEEIGEDVQSARQQVREIADNLKGLPLGVLPGSRYDSVQGTLAPGQMVAMYSDGLTDAVNQEGQTYDLARFKEMLATAGGGPPASDSNTAGRIGSDSAGTITVEAIGRNLIHSIRQFSANTPQADDQCLVLFGRLE